LAPLGVLGREPAAGLLGLAGRLGDAVDGVGDAGLLDADGREGAAAGRCAGAALTVLEAPFFNDAPQKGHSSASSSRTD
jgi:hypothetical protein